MAAALDLSSKAVRRWYDAGSFANTGCQIDLLHARVKAADETLRNLRWLAADEVA